MHRFSRILMFGLGLSLLAGGRSHGQSEPADGQSPTFRRKPVGTWIADLKDKDLAVRRAAATALVSRIDKSEPGSQVAEALLPVLLETLKDTDTIVRRQAALAWVRCHEIQVRFQQDKLAGGQDGKVLLPVLLDALEDGDAEVRKWAASSIVLVNRDQALVMAPLAALLKDPHWRVREEAARALGAMEPPGAAIPALTGALDDPNVSVRRSAVTSLGMMGEPGRAVVPRLIAALKDSDEGVCAGAARALGSLHRDTNASVPALIDVLRAEARMRSLRESAAGALGCFGPAARSALPALRTALQDEDPSVRCAALSSLSEIDPDSEETQASLVAALRDENEMVRERTARLCESLGPRAKVSVPTLLWLLKNEKDEEVRYFVQSALKKIDPGAAKRAGAPDGKHKE